MSMEIPFFIKAESKPRELRGQPERPIRSLAAFERKVQRLFRKEVVASATKRAAPKGDEIVWSTLGNVAALILLSGSQLATANEHQRPYSGKLEALSKFEVRKPVMQALRNDAVKTFDRAAWAQFKATPLHVVPASAGTSTATLTLTTNGTATATNNIAFQKEHAKLLVDLMKERNIPEAVNDGDYMRGIAA